MQDPIIPKKPLSLTEKLNQVIPSAYQDALKYIEPDGVDRSGSSVVNPVGLTTGEHGVALHDTKQAMELESQSEYIKWLRERKEAEAAVQTQQDITKKFLEDVKRIQGEPKTPEEKAARDKATEDYFKFAITSQKANNKEEALKIASQSVEDESSVPGWMKSIATWGRETFDTWVSRGVKFNQDLTTTVIGGVMSGAINAVKNYGYLFDVQHALNQFDDFVFNAAENERLTLQKDYTDYLAYNSSLPAELRPEKSLSWEDYQVKYKDRYRDKRLYNQAFAELNNWSKDAVKGAINAGYLDAKYADNETGNWFTSLLQQASESAFSYVFDKEKSDFANTMFAQRTVSQEDGDAGYWWDVARGTITSAVEFVVPGSNVSKGVGTAQRLLGQEQKIYKLTEQLGRQNFLNVVTNKLSSRPGALTHGIASGLIMNYMESAMMGVETYQQALDEFAPLVEKGTMTVEEARFYASEAAASVEHYNKYLAVLNMVEMMGLARGKGFIYNDIRKQSAKQMLKSTVKANFDNPIIQAGQEGAEELIQALTQAEQIYQQKQAAGIDQPDKKTSVLGRAIDNLSDIDTWSQGIAGAFGGPVQRIGTKVLSGDLTKAGISMKKRQQLHQESIVKKTEEYFKNRAASMQRYLMLRADAVMAGDNVTEEMIKELHRADIALQNFDAGTTASLEAMLKETMKSNLSEEELNARGLDKNYKAEAKKFYDEIQQLKKDYTRSTRYNNPAEMTHNRMQVRSFNNAIQATHAEIQDKTKQLKALELQTAQQYAPELPELRYDTDESGNQVPVFESDWYKDVTDGMSKAEKSAFVKRLKKAEQAYKNNEDISDLQDDLYQTQESVKKAEAHRDKLDDRYEAMKTADYQFNLYAKRDLDGNLVNDVVAELIRGVDLRGRQQKLARQQRRLGRAKMMDNILRMKSPFNAIAFDTRALSKYEAQPQEKPEEIKPSETQEPITTVQETQEPQDKQEPQETQPAETKPTVVSSVSQNGLREDASGTNDISVVLNTMSDGTKESYVVIDGVIKDRKTHAADVSDEDIINMYADVFNDPETVWEETLYKTKTDNNIDKDVQQEAENQEILESIDPEGEYNSKIDEELSDPITAEEENYPIHQSAKPEEGNSLVAHKHRSFTLEGNTVVDLDDEFNLASKGSADFNKVKEGTSVSFEVVDDNSIPMTHPDQIGTIADRDDNAGKTITWGDYKLEISQKLGVPLDQVHTTEEYVKSVPIAIKTADGTLIGYVHQTAWIHPSKVQSEANSEELEADKMKSFALRNNIVNNNFKSAKITSRSAGWLFKTAKMQRTSVQMQDKNLKLAIANNGQLHTNKREEIDLQGATLLNAKNLKNGLLYAVVKVNTNEYVALPLRQNVFSAMPEDNPVQTQAYVLDLIERALNHTFVKSDPEFAKQIYESTNGAINLDKKNKNQKVALEEFINHFVFVRNLGQGIENLTEYYTVGAGQSLSTNKFVVGFIKGHMMFGTAMSLHENTEVKDAASIKQFMGYLRGDKAGVEVYFSPKLTSLNNKKIGFPVTVNNEDGTTSTQVKAYQDIVKENTNVNIKGNNIGTQNKPMWVYTAHPTISFDQEKVVSIQPEPPQEKTPTATIEQIQEAENNIANILDDFGSSDAFYMDELTSEEKNEIKKTTEHLAVAGLTSGQQTELINYLTLHIINTIFSNPTKNLQRAVIFENVKKGFEAKLSMIRTAINSGLAQKDFEEGKITESQLQIRQAQEAKVLATYEAIIDKWSQITNLTISNLDSFDQVKMITNEEDDGVEQMSSNENANWDAVSAFTIDSKNTSSAHLKKFFAGISNAKKVTKPDPNDPTKVIITYEGPKTFFGEPQPIGFDVVFDIVQRLLSNQGPNKSVKRYMEILRSHAKHFPFLDQVVDKLESSNTDESLRNEFFKVMTKHYVDMRYVMVEESYNGEYKLKHLEDNANSVFRAITSLWKNQLNTNGLLVFQAGEDTEQTSGSYIYDPDTKKIILASLKDLKEKAQQEINKAAYEAKKLAEESKGKEFKQKLTYDEDKLFTNADKEQVKKILGAFGITLNENTWQDLLDGKFKLAKGNRRLTFAELLTHNDSPIVVLQKALESGKTTTDKHPLDETAVQNLARFEADRAKNLYSNTHFSNNKIIFSFSNNKYMIDRFFTLKEDVNKLTQLANNPYTKDSLWLRNLVKLNEDGSIFFDDNKKVVINTDSNFHQTFTYFVASLEPLKSSHRSQDHREMHKLTDMEIEIYRMAGIQSFQTSVGTKRNFALVNPTSSDKTTVMNWITEAVEIAFNQDGTLKQSEGNDFPDVIDHIYNHVVQSEINAIRNFTVNNQSGTGYSGIDEGGALFYFFPTLNTEVPGLFVEQNGKRTLNPSLYDPNSKEGAALKKAIKQEVNNVLKNMIDEKLALWKSYDIGTSDDNHKFRYMNSEFIKRYYKSNNVVLQAATDMVIQTLFGQANIYQLFIGNPAQFFKAVKGLPLDDASIPAHIDETFTNINKRLAGDIAPGETIFTEEDGVVQYVFADDPKCSSKVYDDIKKLIGEDKASKYKGITITDGQEFTTVKEHALLLFKAGKISKGEYDAIISKIKAANGGYYTLDEKLKKALFQPTKPVYVENHVDEGKGVEIRMYVKSSTFPLLPELVVGTSLDKLRKAMEDMGIDRFAFKSAVKSGSTTHKLDLFDSEGKVKGSLDEIRAALKAAKTLTPALSRTGLRIQQEVPYKAKLEINKVTQASKNLFTNMLNETGFIHPVTKKSVTGSELKKFYDSVYGELYELTQKEFFEEIEFDTESGTYNQEILKRILKDEAYRRGWPISEQNAISHIDFTDAVAFTAFEDRYQSLMMSLVNNRIIKTKLSGISAVLGTEAGFSSSELTKEKFQEIIAKRGKGIAFTSNYDHSTGLMPSRVVEDKLLPAQAIIPWKFKADLQNYIDPKTNMLDLSKIDPELLVIIGMRIPNQGLNSSSAIEIVGFTTDSSGDLFIATQDFITQMGSDFDIDKIYAYVSPYIEKDGKLKKLSNVYNRESAQKAIKNSQAELTVLKDTLKDLSLDFDKQKEKAEVKKNIAAKEKEIKEFKKYYKQLIQSDIIDVHKAVLMNPSDVVQKAIKEPLSEWELGRLAKDFERIKSKQQAKKYTVPCLLSDQYQKTKFINATAGKSGVAIFSLDNIFNSLCQYTKGMQIFDDRSKGILLTVKFGNKISYGELHHERGFDAEGNLDKGEYKSLIIQGYQSAAVDNEKLQILDKLNINDSTFNVIKLLNQLGFGEEVIYFINQPIIIDYIKELKRLKGKFDEKGLRTSDLEQKARDFVVAKYASTNGYDANSEYAENEGIETLANMLEFQSNTAEYKWTSKQKEVFDTDIYFNTQVALLDKFLYLNSKGQELGVLESTSNIDSSGIGASLPVAMVKQQNIETFLTDGGNIEGAYKIFTDTPWDKDTSGIITETSIPNTINGFAYYRGLNTAIEVFGPLFKYHSDSFNNTFNQVLSFSSMKKESVDSKADFMQEIWQAQKAYLFASSSLWHMNPGETVQSVRQKMLFDSYRFTPEITTDDQGREKTRKTVISVENYSLARLLALIKTMPIGNNAFLARLTPNVALRPTKERVTESVVIESELPSIIKFNAASKETSSDNDIYLAFSDLIVNDRIIKDAKGNTVMFEGKPFTSSKLAQQLILYAFLNNNRQEAIQFFKYIPHSYLHATGIFNKLSSLDFDNLGLFGLASDRKAPSILVKQIFQHNPNWAPKVDVAKLLKVNGQLKGNKSPKAGEIRTFVASKNDQQYFIDDTHGIPFVQMYNAGTASKYNLYQFTGIDENGNFMYTRIDTLGTFGVTEYVLGQQNQTSLISKNRALTLPIAEVKTPVIPTVAPPKSIINTKPIVLADPKLVTPEQYGFKNNTGEEAKATINLVLTTIAQKGNDPFLKQLAQDLLGSEKNIPITVNDTELTLSLTKEGSRYNPSNHTLFINPASSAGSAAFERVFMHELLHLLTLDAIRNPNKLQLNVEQKKAVNNLRRLRQAYYDHFNEHADKITKAKFKIFVLQQQVYASFRNNKITLDQATKQARENEQQIIQELALSAEESKLVQVVPAEVKNITQIYNTEDRQRFYAAVNTEEFVSEMMTNPKVIKEASNIIYKEPLFNDNGELKPQSSIISKFKEFVTNLIKAFHGNNISSLAIDNVLQLLEVKPQAKSLKDYINYSGAAKGSDQMWAKIGKEFGLTKQVDFLAQNYDNMPEELRIEAENAYKNSLRFLNRAYIKLNNDHIKDAKTKKSKDFIGRLVRRDYFQIKNAEAVFAIINGLENVSQNNTKYNALPKGGTAYAVTMALELGKPVYVFDQSSNKWLTFNSLHGWTETETPVLTEKFAGIGTREITSNGEQAIRDVYAKTTNTSLRPIVLQQKPVLPKKEEKSPYTVIEEDDLFAGAPIIDPEDSKMPIDEDLTELFNAAATKPNLEDLNEIPTLDDAIVLKVFKDPDDIVADYLPEGDKTQTPQIKFFNKNKPAILRYFEKDAMTFKEYQQELADIEDLEVFYNYITRC